MVNWAVLLLFLCSLQGVCWGAETPPDATGQEVQAKWLSAKGRSGKMVRKSVEKQLRGKPMPQWLPAFCLKHLGADDLDLDVRLSVHRVLGYHTESLDAAKFDPLIARMARDAKQKNHLNALLASVVSKMKLSEEQYDSYVEILGTIAEDLECRRFIASCVRSQADGQVKAKAKGALLGWVNTVINEEKGAEKAYDMLVLSSLPAVVTLGQKLLKDKGIKELGVHRTVEILRLVESHSQKDFGLKDALKNGGSVKDLTQVKDAFDSWWLEAGVKDERFVLSP